MVRRIARVGLLRAGRPALSPPAQPPSIPSSCTLTQRVTERNLGVPREYASFAMPLGSATKTDGCAAISPAVAAIFVARFFGIELTIVQYLLIALVPMVGSTATAGTTGATVMLTLSTLGLPLEGVGDVPRRQRVLRMPGACSPRKPG